jgi:hypothetical protein
MAHQWPDSLPELSVNSLPKLPTYSRPSLTVAHSICISLLLWHDAISKKHPGDTHLQPFIRVAIPFHKYVAWRDHCRLAAAVIRVHHLHDVPCRLPRHRTCLQIQTHLKHDAGAVVKCVQVPVIANQLRQLRSSACLIMLHKRYSREVHETITKQRTPVFTSAAGSHLIVYESPDRVRVPCNSVKVSSVIWLSEYHLNKHTVMY